MSKLELLLNKEKYDPKEIFSKLKITDYAFKKANAYAKLLTKMTHKPLECYGYLLADKNNNELVTDVFLLKQEVTESECSVLPEGKKKFHDFINGSNYTHIGWWHSHGSFDSFHSHTDMGNMKKRLASTNNKKFLGVKQKRLLSGNIDYSIYTKDNITELALFNNDQKKIVLELENIKLIQNGNSKIKNIYEKENQNSFFVYSLVVNKKGNKPYCEVIYTNPYSGSSENKILELEIVRTNKDSFSYKDIKEDISNKIIHDGDLIADIRTRRLNDLLSKRNENKENEKEIIRNHSESHIHDPKKLNKILLDINKNISKYDTILKNITKENNFHVIYNNLLGIKRDLESKEFLIRKYETEHNNGVKFTLSCIDTKYSEIEKRVNYYLSYFDRKINYFEDDIASLNQKKDSLENKKVFMKSKKIKTLDDEINSKRKKLCVYENFKKFFEEV